ncbi:hypothetical protein GP486_006104 [Trichoglossum hirsutum]|uniref:Uncharacterized protein n=1 Tax=Trichoglossum hirsutum TaxID=265104 RepID=A0A9P8L804_9PEZI|nr:hypothetical protein GP486_006104 [Trichoglossum hirsutum]
MEPWKSWTAFVALGAGAGWYYYNTQNKHKTKTGRAASSTVDIGNKPARKREESKAKSRKDGVVRTRDFSESDLAEGSTAVASNVPALKKDKTRKGKGTKTKAEKLGVGSTIKAVETADGNLEKTNGSLGKGDGTNEEMDNEEFAKMLSELKSNRPAKDPTKKRQREEGTKANGMLLGGAHLSVAEPVGSVPHNSSTTSSTTGADADDDLSPAASPSMKPKSVGEAHEDAGLSDMLETPRPGPSVLRLTEPTQPARTQKSRQLAPQIQETKKQRQNRMKNEARKAEREEAENERRALLENQRRIVREAEGRPAKNGIGAVSKTPVASAWAGPRGPVNGESEPEGPPKTEDIVYLDTFDDNHNARADDSSSAKDTLTNSWERDLPSEEEQMRLLNEMGDGGWNTVSGTKKGKKKGAIGSGHTSNESGPEKQVEITKRAGPIKGPSTSKSANLDVWGYGNVTPHITRKGAGADADDDWAVDGGWEVEKH